MSGASYSSRWPTSKMDVILGSACILCQETTAVLSRQFIGPYFKYLHSTFFDKNVEGLEEFTSNIGEGSMCVLCSHQVVIAHKFKDAYEGKCKKDANIRRNYSGCFLCEQKSVDVIQTSSNPNEFTSMMSQFMGTSDFTLSAEKCHVCLDCIFYLSIWHKIFCYIQKRSKLLSVTNNLTSSTQTKTQKRVHFNEDATIIESTGYTAKSSQKRRKPSPPPPPAIKTSPKQTSPVTRKRKIAPEPVSKNKKPGPLFSRSKKSKKQAKPERKAKKDKKAGPLFSKTALKAKHKRKKPAVLKGTLKKQLKHLKSLKQANRRKTWPSDVLHNAKMYLQVPYVLLTQQPLDETEEPLELIEISSDEEVTIKKQGFKIKMSQRFMASLKSKTKKKQPQSYTCNICDKPLSSLSEYKRHTLWHDKPEYPVINVSRSNFSQASSNSDENEGETQNVAVRKETPNDVNNPEDPHLNETPTEIPQKEIQTDESDNKEDSEKIVEDSNATLPDLEDTSPVNDEKTDTPKEQHNNSEDHNKSDEFHSDSEYVDNVLKESLEFLTKTSELESDADDPASPKCINGDIKENGKDESCDEKDEESFAKETEVET